MIEVRDLGIVRYAAALEVMERTHASVRDSGGVGDGTLLVVEHPPVVTMGNRYVPGDMRMTEDELVSSGIDFARIDRGGSVTVHEPGQAVVYPIVKLDPVRLGPRKLVWIVEQAIIDLCAAHGVDAARDEINPGVWVGYDKVGAVGLRIRDGVSMHGIAVNVTNDLSTFGAIVPCGLRGRGVTSLWRLLASRDACLSHDPSPTPAGDSPSPMPALPPLSSRDAGIRLATRMRVLLEEAFQSAD